MEVESSLPNGTPDSNRRKSGRVIRRPELYGDEQHDTSTLSNASTKRKRTQDTYDAAESEDESDSQSEDESDEDQSDEVELPKKSRSKRNGISETKPVAKRARIGRKSGKTLAIRSANAQDRPTSKAAKVQRARARPSQIHREDLYAQVFGHGKAAEDAAAFWLESLDKDSVAAIRDLINFVLECIGCEIRVESHDIEDLDNVPNRLGDILEEYAQNKDAEYPLTSRSKQYIGFREVLIQFFDAIIKSLHASSVLYEQPEVYDNIHVWLATMSGAGYRPFRHTATVISLTMTTALCEVAQEIQSSLATTRTQLETEKKKKSVNKGRVQSMQQDLKSDEQKIETVDAYLRDAFDTVYVHRYRDVDEKIRVECVYALGNWIVQYRQMFLEGQYLRYLGWMLSDPNSPTRLEVIRQLKTLFKNQRNIAALRAFTERFRSRIVEMGTRDADISVRVETIELLDRLRNAELLEPDDIDTIGRLVFDTEPRIRKAVAKFFVSNIEDLYKASIEDMDADDFAAALPVAPEDDDFLSPQQSWIKFKSLAQTLTGYDRDGESVHGNENDKTGFDSAETDSRFMLATQSIYQYMLELHKWESLAGYLLCDHSSITAEADDSDVNLAVQGAYKLSTGEEIVLLDVLYMSTKLYLQSVVEIHTEKGRKTNATRDETRGKQESAAHNLIVVIPQLLNKFGSVPQAATSILRLEQLLDVDLINDLQSGEVSYSSLLEDINKQFISHSDPKVLAEASKSLRVARTYDQSRAVADAKVAEIWNDAITALANLLRGKSIETRGTLERNVLAETVSICIRLASVASINDCTENLESQMPAATNKRKSKGAKEQTLLEVLFELLKRGVPDEETTAAFAEIEDELCIAIVNILSLYFRWKMVALKNAIERNLPKSLSTSNLVNFSMQRTNLVELLIPIIEARLPLDPIRVSCIVNVLELFTLYATLRHAKPTTGVLDEEIKTNLTSLVTEMPSQLLTEIMLTHARMEKSLARKTNRKLGPGGDNSKKGKSSKATLGDQEDDSELQPTQEEIEAPPEDSDDEDNNNNHDEENQSDESDLDGEEGDHNPHKSGGREAKRQAALIAEQQLCELTSKIVLASIAGVVDDKKVKPKLQVNRAKLGKSYNQIIAYLDDEKKTKRGRKARDDASAAATTASTTAAATSQRGANEKNKGKTIGKHALSEAMVIEGDDIQDDDDDEEEEQNNDEEEGEDEIEDEERDGDEENVVGGGGRELEDEIMGD